MKLATAHYQVIIFNINCPSLVYQAACVSASTAEK